MPKPHWIFYYHHGGKLEELLICPGKMQSELSQSNAVHRLEAKKNWKNEQSNRGDMRKNPRDMAIFEAVVYTRFFKSFYKNIF